MAMPAVEPEPEPKPSKPGGKVPPRKPTTPTEPGDDEPEPTDKPSKPREPDAEPEVIIEPIDAAYIYDPLEVRTYDVTLSEADLAFLDANPEAEEYVEGTLKFEGETFGPVGIRYKGSAGAFRYSGCLSPEGSKACTKMSVKVSFDWQDPDARFYGLRKLQFHAMFHDRSMLKERLGYWMYREFGIPAPRAVHARLRVNGLLIGLFTLVEQIDGRFTRSRFSEGGEGNLYKEAWPLREDRTATTEDLLIGKLQTNEDENPVFDGMIGFAQELERAPMRDLHAVLERYTDIDTMLRYIAVDRTIAVDDGPFHWYCSGGTCRNHNYYWYETENHDKLWLIPWDLDGSFNLDNPVITIWMPWDDTGLACAGQTQPPFEVPLRPPACDKLTLGWATMQQRWLNVVRDLLRGPFSPGTVEDRLREWEAQIEPSVELLAGGFNDAVSVADWRQALQELRQTIETLRTRAQDRVAAGPRTITDPWPGAEAAGETAPP